MAVEMFSWPSLHDRMCRIVGMELRAACMPGEHASDRTTAPDSGRGEDKLINLWTNFVKF